MKEFERRRCLKCGAAMHIVDGSDRTTRDRVWFTLRCPRCLHTEIDWRPRTCQDRDKR